MTIGHLEGVFYNPILRGRSNDHHGTINPLLTWICDSSMRILMVIYHGGIRKKSPKSNKFKERVGVSKNRGTPKWLLYDGKPY